MTKLAILKKRIVREYNKRSNWDYSKFKGYPEDTYFGYSSLNECITSIIQQFKAYYGKNLKYWRYD